MLNKDNRGKCYNASSQKQRRRRQNGEHIDYVLTVEQAFKAAGLAG